MRKNRSCCKKLQVDKADHEKNDGSGRAMIAVHESFVAEENIAKSID